MPSPFPELPLPIRVADLEIAGGVPDLHRCHGYGGVFLLLRRHGYPLGSVTLSVSDDRVHAGAIAQALMTGTNDVKAAGSKGSDVLVRAAAKSGGSKS